MCTRFRSVAQRKEIWKSKLSVAMMSELALVMELDVLLGRDV